MPRFIIRHTFRFTVKPGRRLDAYRAEIDTKKFQWYFCTFILYRVILLKSCLANHPSLVPTFIICVVREYVSQSLIVGLGGMENCNRIWCFLPFGHWFILHATLYRAEVTIWLLFSDLCELIWGSQSFF